MRNNREQRRRAARLKALNRIAEQDHEPAARRALADLWHAGGMPPAIAVRGRLDEGFFRTK